MPADDDDHEGHPHAFGIGIPASVINALRTDHDAAHARSEDRYLAAMRWLDSQDVEGLMALRWVLASSEDGAYGNNRFYDGMVVQLLRGKGVDPGTGLDPAAALLERESYRPPSDDD